MVHIPLILQVVLFLSLLKNVSKYSMPNFKTMVW